MSYDGWIIIVASLVGIACGTVGCLLILRKLSMLADAISHTVLLGIVGAYFISQTFDGWMMIIGAMIVGIATAFFVQVLDSSGVQSDAAIGVVFTFLFAIGVIFISVFAGNVHLDVEHVLMGEIAFVPWNTFTINGIHLGPKSVWILGTVLLINLILLFVFYKEFKICAFDSELAASLGIPVLFIHYLLMGMVSTTTVAAFESVGVVLVVAMLIVPGATAYLLTDRLIVMFLLSAFFGVLAAIFGYYLAKFMNVSIAGAMVTVSGLLFALTFVFSPSYGLLAKYLAKKASP